MRATLDEAVLLLSKWAEDETPVLVFLPGVEGSARVAAAGRVMTVNTAELRVTAPAQTKIVQRISLEDCKFAYGAGAEMAELGIFKIPGAQSYVAIVSTSEELTVLVELV